MKRWERARERCMLLYNITNGVVLCTCTYLSVAIVLWKLGTSLTFYLGGGVPSLVEVRQEVVKEVVRKWEVYNGFKDRAVLSKEQVNGVPMAVGMEVSPEIKDQKRLLGRVAREWSKQMDCWGVYWSNQGTRWQNDQRERPPAWNPYLKKKNLLWGGQQNCIRTAIQIYKGEVHPVNVKSWEAERWRERQMPEIAV